jgi:hypothetical protein
MTPTNFTLFRLTYRAEAVLLEGVKHRSLRTATATPACPSEDEEKDLLESDRLKVMTNLQKYQEETRAWRDPKVKLREFEVGNSVLLRICHILKFSFQNVNHFSHKELKISKRIHLF